MVSITYPNLILIVGAIIIALIPLINALDEAQEILESTKRVEKKRPFYTKSFTETAPGTIIKFR